MRSLFDLILHRLGPCPPPFATAAPQQVSVHPAIRDATKRGSMQPS
jgi:hypothetical protein